MKEAINVQARTVETPPAGLNLGDLYYIFFRHKGKIALIFLLAVAAAVALYNLTPKVYQSEAKILIRYIMEGRSPSPSAAGQSGSQSISPDSRGDNIINSEVEILTSLDLAIQVAEQVRPRKILAKEGGGTNLMRAAGLVRRGLEVTVPKQSSIIRIVFRYPDADVVQPVLSQLVETYLKKHVEIHQGVGVLDEFFSRQTDELRSRLSQTEDDLKKRKTDAGVLSLEDDKRSFIVQKERIENDLFAAEAELAEKRASLQETMRLNPGRATVDATETNISPEIADRYRMVCAELDILQKRQADLRWRFTDAHPQVNRLAEEIVLVDGRKKQLEKDNPKIVALMQPPLLSTKDNPDPAPALALRVSALEAKIKVLTNQLAVVRSDAVRIIEVEPAITQLQRRKELEEANFRYYSSSLEQARINDKLGNGKVTNINIVQTPSPAGRALDDLMKPVGIILALGLFGGFGLAFLIERVLNQSIKRITDVERQLRVPVFVTLPDLGWHGAFRLPRFRRNGHAPLKAEGSVVDTNSPAQPDTAMAVAPWSAEHQLRPYFDGLRDRLITFFEVREMTHKPKLVAVTGCGRGTGVSTLASGLAAALSETGDGSVLLVDMNIEQGAAHPFHQGKPGCGLSDALENGKRSTAQVQENLYLVSAHETNNDKLPRVLPKRFAHLVPRMKASDYDYIIFDMPPITQTSVTPRLAGFMDMVLMVIESEKTGQDLVKRAGALLHESRANVAAVLNKHRNYVPQSIGQEL